MWESWNQVSLWLSFFFIHGTIFLFWSHNVILSCTFMNNFHNMNYTFVFWKKVTVELSSFSRCVNHIIISFLPKKKKNLKWEKNIYIRLVHLSVRNQLFINFSTNCKWWLSNWKLPMILMRVVVNAKFYHKKDFFWPHLYFFSFFFLLTLKK